jgi:hypothetical protein
MVGQMRKLYGDTPLHLLAVIASFALAGYAFLQIAGTPTALGTFVWFAAAIVAHDLLAFPLYSLLNFVAHRGVSGRESAREERRAVPVINHLRIPFALSALAFALFFPEILGLDSSNYEQDAGLGTGVFFDRWLGLCAALFLGSAVIYALRLRLVARRAAAAAEGDADADASGDACEGGDD